MNSSVKGHLQSISSGTSLRRVRDATETKRRISPPAEAATRGPVLPETGRLLDRLLSSETLELARPVPACDAPRVLGYCVRPDTHAPYTVFQVASADAGVLRFLGQPEPGFEVLRARQAGLQFHWRSDLMRVFEEQAAILGAFCAFAKRGELVIEHLAMPVIRRSRVREIHGWFILGRDFTDDLCGPDSLTIVRRPLRARLVRLPRRLLHPPRTANAWAGAMTSLQQRWELSTGSDRSR